MVVGNVEALLEVFAYRRRSDSRRVVSRIVQYLNLNQLAWVLEPCNCIDQTLSHIHLIEQRQLHSHSRQAVRSEFGFRLRAMFLIAQEQINKTVKINTIYGQQPQNREVDPHEIQVQRVVDVQIADVARGIATALCLGRCNILVDRRVAGLSQGKREQFYLSSLAALTTGRADDLIHSRTHGDEHVAPRLETFEGEDR